MVFLLTGEPTTGKSTVARSFIEKFPADSDWVVTNEIQDKNGNRIGYKAVSSRGSEEVIGHKTAINSTVVVGHNRYFIDTSKLHKLFTEPLQHAIEQPGRCLVLDEIGNIQRLDPDFLPTVKKAFDANVNLLATIRIRDEWTVPFRQHKHAVCLSVTPESRDQLPDILIKIFNNVHLLNKLNKTQQMVVLSMSRKFAERGQLLQLDKLFRYAITYVSQGRVSKITASSFSVKGYAGQYTVTTNGDMHCTCDLYLGRGKYNEPGKCSHIMAVKLQNQ